MTQNWSELTILEYKKKSSAFSWVLPKSLWMGKDLDGGRWCATVDISSPD